MTRDSRMLLYPVVGRLVTECTRACRREVVAGTWARTGGFRYSIAGVLSSGRSLEVP